MTAPSNHTTDDETNETEAVPAFGRVWQKRNPHQGSSPLSLKAMAVLYDAGQPLSRDELADRLLPQLDAYACSYLEAWWLRKTAQGRAKILRHRHRPVTVAEVQPTVTSQRALRAWLSAVFAQRVRHSHTLLRDPDGRFRPGPIPPQVQTLDGRIMDFTPEARHALEQADHDQGRTYRALLEWKQVTATLDLTTVAARSQLLMYLAQRFGVGSNPSKLPLDGRRLVALFDHLLTLADTPAVQRAVLQHALDAIWPAAPETEAKP